MLFHVRFIALLTRVLLMLFYSVIEGIGAGVGPMRLAGRLGPSPEVQHIILTLSGVTFLFTCSQNVMAVAWYMRLPSTSRRR